MNQALAYLGNPPVPTVNTADPVINAMSVIYDCEKSNLLAWHPWRFATKWKELILTNPQPPTPADPYLQNSYDMPVDYVQALDVYPWSNYNIMGDFFLTNQQPGFKLQYVFDIPDGNYPQYFASALSHTLAAKSATLLTENSGIADYWQKRADIQCLKAQNRDSTAVPAQTIRDNPLLAAHWFRTP